MVRPNSVPLAFAFFAASLAASLVAQGGTADARPDASAGPSNQRLPNIVYIMADDLGFSELGSYGQKKIKTPHLDALASAGMRFTQHYAGAPVCAPSRCVLLTGKHSGNATVRDNLEHKPEGQKPILAEDLTIPEVLKIAGYATGCFGKWGLGFPGSVGDPLQQGFQRFYGYNCQRHAHNFYPRYLWSDGQKVMLEGNDRGLTGAQYSHDLIEKELERFVRDHQDKPFFAYVPFTIPHLALQVPDKSLNEYLGKFEETPYRGRSYLPHDTPRAAYAAMISHMDRSVGRLVALLDELGLTDNTLVIFTSDNGTTHLGKQADYEFFESVKPLRGLKGSVYEGGIRVPMIAKWPGKIQAGSTSDHVSAFYDVMPTLVEIAGLPALTGIDGLSFAPELLGRHGQQVEHEFLFWDFPGYGGQVAIRAGRFKALRRGLRKNPDAPLELYDLENDIGETTNVAKKYPEIAERLAYLLVAERTEPVYPKLRFWKYAEN